MQITNVEVQQQAAAQRTVAHANTKKRKLAETSFGNEQLPMCTRSSKRRQVYGVASLISTLQQQR